MSNKAQRKAERKILVAVLAKVEKLDPETRAKYDRTLQEMRHEKAAIAACEHESISAANGHGAYCKHCGETLA